jgi:hypothetical protein
MGDNASNVPWPTFFFGFAFVAALFLAWYVFQDGNEHVSVMCDPQYSDGLSLVRGQDGSPRTS